MLDARQPGPGGVGERGGLLSLATGLMHIADRLDQPHELTQQPQLARQAVAVTRRGGRDHRHSPQILHTASAASAGPADRGLR